ncbi:MAG: MmcB family DNA repair protein [Henriciella sp.]|nr:MmcB family DNA repair protein [Henriciella sp.]
MIETDLPTASRICRGVLRLLSEHGFAGVTELTLANGRRADVAAIGQDGKVVIVEIKSSVADFRADSKWPEYAGFCDRFYFAIEDGFPRDLIPGHTGLIIADAFGGAFLREPKEARLAPARRKAVTLRFARLAATRLNQAVLQV